MNKTLEELNAIHQKGYKLEVNKYVDEGWFLFRSSMGPVIGFLAIIAGAEFLINLVMPEVYAVFGDEYIIMGFNILIAIAFTVLKAGVFNFYDEKSRFKNNDFSIFFKCIQYAKPILLYNLMLIVFMIPLAIVAMFYSFPITTILSGGELDAAALTQLYYYFTSGEFAIVALLYVLLSIYLFVSYVFTIPLIVSQGLSFWDAMEVSRKVAGKKFFKILGYMILGGLLVTVFTVIVGLLLGFIPVINIIGIIFYGLVLAGFISGITYRAFYNIFEIGSSDLDAKLSQLGVDQEDINTEAQEG